jgi:hypothetical protein
MSLKLLNYTFYYVDRLCSLALRVPGSIPVTNRFFWEVIDLERGPLSLVSTTEELLGRNSSGSRLENLKYGHGIRRADHATPSFRRSWH